MWLWTTMAAGATLNVGANFPTITAAVAAALHGDTIELSAGSYTESIDTSKDLTFVGLPGSSWHCSDGTRCLYARGQVTLEDRVMEAASGGVEAGESLTVLRSSFLATTSSAALITGSEVGSVTLVDVTFSGPAPRHIELSNSNASALLTVEGCSFYDGGVAIHASGPVESTITGGVFSALTEGVTYTEDVLTLTSSVVERTHATKLLHAVGHATLNNVTFDSNEGQLLYAAAGADLSTVALTNNSNSYVSPLVPTATDNTGLLHLPSGASVSDLTATGNDVGTGPVLLLKAGMFDVSHVVASGNSGGVITVNSGANVSFRDLHLHGNGGADDGGAILIDESTVTLEDSLLQNNLGLFLGGAVSSRDSTLTILNSEFVGNEAHSGGAVSLMNGVLILKDSIISGNIGDLGAGIAASNATVEIQTTLFTNNAGGAVSGDNNDLTLTASVLAGNSPGNDPSYFGNTGAGETVIENTAFIDNTGLLLGGPLTTLSLSFSWFDSFAGLEQAVVNVLPSNVLEGGDPMFEAWSNDGDASNDSFLPLPASFLIDAGSSHPVDPDGSPADIGRYTGFTHGAWIDEDGDGSYLPDDCDDMDASLHPDGIEVCNGVDDNCDGVVDEDLLITAWRDQDADGLGAGESEVICLGTPGYVLNNDDYDDSNGGVGSEPPTSPEGPTDTPVDTTTPETTEAGQAGEKPTESSGCSVAPTSGQLLWRGFGASRLR